MFPPNVLRLIETNPVKFLPKTFACQKFYAACLILISLTFLLMAGGFYQVEKRPVNSETTPIYAQKISTNFRGKIRKKALWRPTENSTKPVGKFSEFFNIFTVNGKPIIWAFWDSADIPALLKLSLATVKCHNAKHFEFQLLQMRNIYDWIDHVHPAFPFLIPAHKADYFRARILDEYGGIYIDADSIGFGSFDTLLRKLLWYDMVNLSWPPDGDKISITTMGPMRARTKFTSSWVTDLHLLLDAKYNDLLKFSESANGSVDYPIEWSEMLRDVVVPIVDKMVAQKMLGYFSVNGPTTFGQLIMSGLDPLEDLALKLEDSFKFSDTELLMYHNSGFPEEIRSLTIDELLEKDIILMELIRMSFAKCRKIKQEHALMETREMKDKNSGIPHFPPLVHYVVPNKSVSLRHDKALMKWIKNYVNNVGF